MLKHCFLGAWQDIKPKGGPFLQFSCHELAKSEIMDPFLCKRGLLLTQHPFFSRQEHMSLQMANSFKFLCCWRDDYIESVIMATHSHPMFVCPEKSLNMPRQMTENDTMFSRNPYVSNPLAVLGEIVLKCPQSWIQRDDKLLESYTVADGHRGPKTNGYRW